MNVSPSAAVIAHTSAHEFVIDPAGANSCFRVFTDVS